MKVKALLNFKYKLDYPEFRKGGIYDIKDTDYVVLNNSGLVVEKKTFNHVEAENKKLTIDYENKAAIIKKPEKLVVKEEKKEAKKEKSKKKSSKKKGK